MKKIFFSLFLLAAGFSLFAQEPVRVTSTGQYPAYTAPRHILVTFERSYPDITEVVWIPVEANWRATYNQNNRLMHVYYYPGGQTHTVSLPVVIGQVPEDVITKSISVFGNNVYDITQMKSSGDAGVYKVRLLENGNFKSEWMNGQGMKVADPYKVKLENDKLKMKTDEQKMKVKMEN